MACLYVWMWWLFAFACMGVVVFGTHCTLPLDSRSSLILQHELFEVLRAHLGALLKLRQAHNDETVVQPPEPTPEGLQCMQSDCA